MHTTPAVRHYLSRLHADLSDPKSIRQSINKANYISYDTAALLDRTWGFIYEPLVLYSPEYDHLMFSLQERANYNVIKKLNFSPNWYRSFIQRLEDEGYYTSGLVEGYTGHRLSFLLYAKDQNKLKKLRSELQRTLITKEKEK